MRLIAACALLSVAAAWAQAPVQRAARPLLLVVDQGDRDLSIVDPVAGKRIASVPVEGVTGHEVAASPDGALAYVPIYGNAGVGKPGTDGRVMDVIDIATRKIIKKVDFGHGVRPHCAVYDPVSGMLYVTTELDKSVAIIDPRSLKIVGSVPTGQQQSHMLALSQNGRWGYTANVQPGTVSVLDLEQRKTVTIIPISAETQRISVSRDDSMVFTADQTKPRLAVIDAATNTLKPWVLLPAIGYGTASTRDGRWLLVALRTSKQVAVIDLKTMKVTQTIDVPGGPTEILMSKDGKTAYVSCFLDHQVAVIDLAAWKVQQRIDVGLESDGLAWTR